MTLLGFALLDAASRDDFELQAMQRLFAEYGRPLAVSAADREAQDDADSGAVNFSIALAKEFVNAIGVAQRFGAESDLTERRKRQVASVLGWINNRLATVGLRFDHYPRVPQLRVLRLHVPSPLPAKKIDLNARIAAAVALDLVDWINVGWWTRIRICRECGVFFTARSHATTCGARCRQRSSRYRATPPITKV